MYRNRTDARPENPANGKFWQGRIWPVYETYTLVTADREDLLHAVGAPIESRHQLQAELRLVEGVLWPEGELKSEYNLSDRFTMDRLWRDASIVRAVDPKAVMEFVSKWGVLGVGCFPTVEGRLFVPEAITKTELGNCDSFLTVRQELIKFQHFATWLKDLTTENLDGLQARKVDGGSSVARLPRSERLAARWRLFSDNLAPHLAPLIPVIIWDSQSRSPRTAFDVDRPALMLWVRIWESVGGGELRRCLNPKCKAYFVRDRGGKRFCTGRCARQASADRYYWKGGGRESRKRRRQATSGV